MNSLALRLSPSAALTVGEIENQKTRMRREQYLTRSKLSYDQNVSPKPIKLGTPESVHDFLSQKNSALAAFFAPKTVAVIGATETAGSVGRTVLSNLISSPFGGTVFPVNPKRSNV